MEELWKYLTTLVVDDIVRHSFKGETQEVNSKDEVQLAVRNDVDPEPIKAIVEAASIEAGEAYGMRIPIASESAHGSTWADTH
jgi:hypothetical protein